MSQYLVCSWVLQYFPLPLDVTACGAVNSGTDSGVDPQGERLSQATFQIITSEGHPGKNRVYAFKSR